MRNHHLHCSMSDNYSRASSSEKTGRKHLYHDVKMGQTSLLPESTHSHMRMEGIVADNESDTQNENTSQKDREEFSAASTNSILGTPLLQHDDAVVSSLRTSPNPTSSQNKVAVEPEAPKPRKRRPKTKEIPPEDADTNHLINLGMSPFMPGQDAMSNQNRLVRNETILARHLSRIQRSQTAAESTNAQRVQDVYRMLGEQKAFIESLQTTRMKGANLNLPSESSLGSDPDFMELVEEQRKTRMILDELNDDVNRFTASTRRMIDDLTEAVQRLSTQNVVESNHPTLTASAESSRSRSVTTGLFSMFSGEESTSTSSMNRILPPISTLNLKRSRTDSIISSVGSFSRKMSTLSTLDQFGAYQQGANTDHNVVFAQIPTQNDPSREVLYGPIKWQETGPASIGSSNNMFHGPNVNAIIDEAVKNVGLSPSMVQSVRVAHGRPDHVSIRFWKVDYTYRFVDLVALGLDKYPDRRAVLVGSNGGRVDGN